MRFKISDLNLIDSFAFLNDSLEQLVHNLYGNDDDDKYVHFSSMTSLFGDHLDLMCQQGIYPYEWVDNIDNMNYVGIPPIEAFRSSVKQEAASKTDYKHVIIDTVG